MCAFAKLPRMSKQEKIDMNFSVVYLKADIMHFPPSGYLKK